MKIKPGFLLHEVCGENVIVATGEENIDFSKIISLNETAACVWKAVADKEFGIADMVSALTAEYEVEAGVAAQDCEALLKAWDEAGLIA